MNSFHMYTIAGLCIYICCLYYDPMYRACNTCCHSMLFPYRRLFQALKRRLDNCLIRQGRGLLSAVVSGVVATLLKRADQKKKDRCKQYSGRRRQMQADADGQADLVDVTRSLDNNISPPKIIWSPQPKCWPRPID